MQMGRNKQTWIINRWFHGGLMVIYWWFIGDIMGYQLYNLMIFNGIESNENMIENDIGAHHTQTWLARKSLD
jgi:hypothetical protein